MWGPRMRSTRAKASADWKALSDIATMEFYRSNQEFDAETHFMDFERILGSGTDHATTEKNIKAITKSTDSVPETVIETTNNHNLIDDDVIYIYKTNGKNREFWGFDKSYYRVVKTTNKEI